MTLQGLGCSVVAVDPGLLSDRVLALQNVVHLRHQLQDCVEEVRARGPYDLCVCDINVDARDAARIIVNHAAPHLYPGGLLVLTLKTFNPKKAGLIERKSVEIIEGSQLFDSVQSQWLFANGKER